MIVEQFQGNYLKSYRKLKMFLLFVLAELKLRHDFEEKQREENVVPGKLSGEKYVGGLIGA